MGRQGTNIGLVQTPVGTATADVADQFSRLRVKLGALHRARMRRLDGSIAVEGRAPDFLAVIPRWSCLLGVPRTCDRRHSRSR